MKSWFNMVVLGGVVTLLTGCSSFIYNVQVMNYGAYGVIVHDKYLGQGHNPLYLSTIAPKGGRLSLPYFKGHPDDIPTGQHEITWQLAELHDCAYEQEVISSDPRFPGIYTARGQCAFTPIPEKIYRKIIDFDEIHDSWAYKKTGLLSSNLGRNTLLLAFIFRDDKLTLDIGNGMTNPWK